MKTLYDVCRSKPKVWRAFPDGSHNDTVAEDGYFNYIQDFIMQQILFPSDEKSEK
jgi:hypothetical protein